MNKIGTNIKKLREYNNETQEELAKRLHRSKSTISEYENGKKIPVKDALTEISKHYGVTVDELINSDFTNLNNKNSKIKIEDIHEKIDLMFPTFGLEKKTNNIHLNKAYLIIRRINRGVNGLEEMNGKLIVDAYTELINATSYYVEDEQELAANLLWVLFFWWTNLVDVSWQREILLKYKLSKISQDDLLEVDRKATKGYIEKRKRFIEDFDELIFSAIKELKANKDWSDLGDYYLALKYAFNIVNTELSIEQNKVVGFQMMYSFGKTGNKYALQFLNL